METITHTPNFAVSLRGYDREEVDQYLESLSDTLGHVDDAEEHNRRLQSHITRLNSRIKELEDRVRSDTPRTGVVLGERIGILLREAEDAAADTIAQAESRAANLIAEADAKVAAADESVRQAVIRAEEQARRIETAARGEAEEIVAEAEARANARTRQIEQWAEQVISHTRAEEVRMLKEQQEKRKAAAAELSVLADHRRSAEAVLGQLHEAIGSAIGIVDSKRVAPFTTSVSAPDSEETDPTAAPPAENAKSEQASSGFMANGSSANSTDAISAIDQSGEKDDTDPNGAIRWDDGAPESIELRDHDADDAHRNEESGQLASDDEEFETKLEAWVSDSPKHFRPH